MKCFRKVAALVMALSIFLSVTCSAAAPGISTYVWNQLSTTYNGFQVDRDGKCIILAHTFGLSDSTEVTLSAYVERLEQGDWNTVPGLSWELTNTSDVFIMLDRTRWVARGYWYRLRTEHSASGPYGTEYDSILSDAVYLAK